MVDISTIEDVTQLKAIAYDLLRERERIQMDLDKVTLQIQRMERLNLKKRTEKEK